MILPTSGPRTLVDPEFVPARGLARSLVGIQQRGFLQETQEASNLSNLAWECAGHFSDGRATVAFVIATILEQISNEFHEARSADPEEFRGLLACLCACGNELISPSGADVMLERSSDLIRAANRWLLP